MVVHPARNPEDRNGISNSMGAIKEYLQILEDLNALENDDERVKYLQSCIGTSERSTVIALAILDKLSKDPNSYFHKAFPDMYVWSNNRWISKTPVTVK